MVTKNYIHPVTGKACTASEYNEAIASSVPSATPTSTGAQDVSGLQASVEGGWTTSDPYSGGVVTQMLNEGTYPSAGILWGQPGAPTIQQLLAGDYPQVSEAGTPTAVMPTFDPGAIKPPAVTPAPPYEPSEAQLAWEETIGGQITDWVEAGGYGIPEETQALMIQQQTDTLKAREQEAIRVMKNNMERRGITNSGYVQANVNMITSGTSVALAGAIADVQIKSALLKLASFEKAMGAAAQFLGYLSEQSQLAHAPKFQTWQAEQLVKMQAWQASFDKYKVELNQAYQTQNMTYAAQIAADAAEQQNIWDVEMAEMEIEAANQQAMYTGMGQLFGTTIGGLFAML